MTIELLPFSAFALESCGGVHAPGESHTLTLEPDLTAVRAAFEPAMGGSASVGAGPVEWPRLLRAAIVPANGSVLTITFQ